MQVKFAVYNCGTGSNRNSPDTVATLHRETITEHIVTDGPGSGGMAPSWAGGGHNPGGAGTIGGMLGGTGVDANVNAVAAEIKRRSTEMKQKMVIAMCGWSRGGVTCFKMANALHRDPATREIPVNIFAIDPVPGGSSLNNHMWQSIDTTPNIRMCHVVLSQHDRRGLFSPYYPPVRGAFTDVDLMPGDHRTVAEEVPGLESAARLVKHLAKGFLMGRGISFKDSSLLQPEQILELYAGVAANFEDYSKQASGVGWLSKKRGTFDEIVRTVKDVHRQQKGQIKPIYDPGQQTGFFLNEHHRLTCRDLYPALTNELDRKPSEAFAVGRRSSWIADFNRSFEQNVEHSKLMMMYVRLCIEAQGT